MLCLPAVAQTRYCIGGSLDHLSAGERASCNAARDMVKMAATRLHAPEDWHFVIVCGEQGWKEYTAIAERGEVALQDSAADTDLDQHVTYLRESRLRDSHIEGGPQQLQLVVAHELAAIQLNTHDERAIEAQVSTWRATLNAQADSSNPARHQEAKPASSSFGV